MVAIDTPEGRKPDEARTTPKKVKKSLSNKTASKAKAAKKTVPKPKQISNDMKEKKTDPTTAQPPISTMVIAALTALKEHRGSSLMAIKKYLIGTYNFDVQKKSIFIKKYLKSAVQQGNIVQTKGIGATGSFKLANPEKLKKNPAPKKKVAVAKETASPTKSASSTTVKKVKKDDAKKPGVSKKSTVAKKPSADKKKAEGKKKDVVTSKISKAASPTKAKVTKAKVTKTKITKTKITKVSSKLRKSAKSPSSKPRAPKPKIAKAIKNADN